MRYLIPLLFLFTTLAGERCYADSSKNTQADVLVLALPAAAYLLTLNREDKPGAWALTKSLGVSAATTLVLNSLIEKDSPNGSSQDAFPSGHATIAFASAGFIQRRYGWRSGLPAYAVASYVGWLRVETDDHDAADVLGGMAVGILSSYLLTKPLGDNAQVAAWSDAQAGGLQFQFRW